MVSILLPAICQIVIKSLVNNLSTFNPFIFTGNNERDNQMYRRIRRHWQQCHPGLSVKSDKEMLKTLVNRDLNAHVICDVETCQFMIDRNAENWRHECINHFVAEHDLTIDHLCFYDSYSGEKLRIQNIFLQVGQCTQPNCYMIRPSTSSQSRVLNTIFKEHYKIHHPKLTDNSFTYLVTNGQAKFSQESEDIKQNDNSSTKQNLSSNNTVIGTSKFSVYECILCSREIKRSQLFNHWNSQHKMDDIKTYKLKCALTNKVMGIQEIFADIGQCQVDQCGDYYGANTTYHPLIRVAREHFRKLHGDDDQFNEEIHFKKISFDQDVNDNVKPSESSEAFQDQDLFEDLVCNHCDKLVSLQSALNHWTKHGLHPATLKIRYRCSSWHFNDFQIDQFN